MSTTFSTANITEDFLASKRNTTDPLADNVIANIISSGNENDVWLKINEQATQIFY